ncbi:hypothetical protein ACLOJK_023135 [Asimina triloba]
MAYQKQLAVRSHQEGVPIFNSHPAVQGSRSRPSSCPNPKSRWVKTHLAKNSSEPIQVHDPSSTHLPRSGVRQRPAGSLASPSASSRPVHMLGPFVSPSTG